MLIQNLESTLLFQRLNQFDGAEKPSAQHLAQSCRTLCEEAASRMRGFPSLHPEYTLHDDVHLLRVVDLMGRVIPDAVLETLNPVELALLILSAYFHDQGMVPEASELSRWRDHSSKEDPQFTLFRDKWMLEHPNLEASRRRLTESGLSEDERNRCIQTEGELLAGLLSDYLRETHGQRSAEFVKNTYGHDPRLVVQSVNLADVLATLCRSHVMSVSDFTEARGFRVDEQIGTYTVNVIYLALVLRLADILDFDRERTPSTLFRTIDFRSPVSLLEWNKHHSVVGWRIEPKLVQFTLQCEHPEYERAAKRFMDWIDEELQNAAQCSRSFPAHVNSYVFDLPIKCDRSRIGPKNKAYLYYDLEFSLSRDEIVKLLMTEKLYGSSSLCVRELLQNSLDALRHRQALQKRSGYEWNIGKIQLFHEVDSHGHEVVRCVDNGVGMTRDIILNFLTKAGRSYYRSPQFEQERIGLRAAGVDFDPCAQFGIGFMSCFMIGDQIKIQTRRDNGSGQSYGEPLEVEINGLGGIVVVRTGADDQPVGTTISITGRKKPRFLDVWRDKVRLIPLLQQYALATEYQVEGKCSVAGIEGSVIIPSTIAKPRTMLEAAGLKKIMTFEQDFSKVHPNLRGCLRTSFILDDNECFTIENDEAFWDIASDGSSWKPALHLKGKEPPENDSRFFLRYETHYNNPIAMDGILVVGEPGREDFLSEDERSRHFFGMMNHNIYVGRARFVLDIRGPIKPPLTPARVADLARSVHDSLGPRWDLIQKFIFQAQGRIWEQVAQKLDARANPELFWQLGIIYNGYDSEFRWMRSQTLWSVLCVPILQPKGQHEWKSLQELGPMTIEKRESDDEQARYKSPSFTLHPLSGGRIGTYQELTHWSPRYQESQEEMPSPEFRHVEWDIHYTVASLSTLLLRDGKLVLEVRSPDMPDESPFERTLGLWNFREKIIPMTYEGELSSMLSVHGGCRSVNRAHPLVRIAREAHYKENKTELEELAIRLLSCLSKTHGAFLRETDQLRSYYREIGSLVIDLDWSSVSSEIQPPYRLRLEDGSTFEADIKLFERWANASPDHRFDY